MAKGLGDFWAAILGGGKKHKPKPMPYNPAVLEELQRRKDEAKRKQST